MSITVPLYGFGGGGGAALNFDVKAYASEEALLAATPAENTIGVVTTTEITSWVISATQPANPEEGMVWISTGTYSTVEFNALKKNTIQVYPISAKQYVNGAGVDVTAMSYQNGEWANWLKYLYKYGDECTDVTGGWESVKSCNGTIEKNEDNITFNVTGVTAKETFGAIYTKKPIDLTSVSILTINEDWVISSTNNGTFTKPMLGISKTIPNTTSVIDSAPALILNGPSLFVNEFSGEYYVFVCVRIAGSTSEGAKLQVEEVAMS